MAARSTPGRSGTARGSGPGSVRVRLGGLCAALLAALGLVLLPPPAGGRAQADTGAAGSAVTESGTKGAYDDFSALKVTVDQTRNLRGQGVHVTWSGGAPTQQGGAGPFGSNYLQFMQCWGDSPAGPDRDQCLYGQGPTGGGIQTASRNVGYQPGDAGLYDPRETQYPSKGASGPGAVPFRTVKGQSTDNIQTYFTPLTTTEQPYATTGADGTGETYFQVESVVEADFLGCGAVASAQQQPKPCWLVVVPRGTHSSDGRAAADSPGSQVDGSPLSTANWAQRIVFRLDFTPVGAYCPIGQKEQYTIGSELATEAMSAWQPALCVDDKTTYGFVQQSEDYARTQIAAPTTGSPGLAFVQNPVVVPDGGPPVVHAPVAVSGIAIGYNIQLPGSSQQRPRLRLDARLVAKLLTASYQCDIPGASTELVRGGLPAGNPRQLLLDPEFTSLNPDYGAITAQSGCRAGLSVPQGNSDYTAEVWRWLRSDPDAQAFLDGKPDPWGMRVNSHFQDLKLGSDTSAEQFQKADPTVWLPSGQHPELGVASVGLNPYAQDLHDDAIRVRRANNTAKTVLDATSVPAKLVNTAPLPGQYYLLGLTDSATAARYRLGVAELRNASGQFVAPTADALTRAVNGMATGRTPGVLDEDPGRRTSGAYPLTAVTYAAASTALDRAVRDDFGTMIRYAAGPGQQAGVGNGFLPAGYAPLTPALRDLALAAAADLVAGRPSAAGPSSGGTPPHGGADASTGGASGGGSGGPAPGGSTGGGAPGAAGGGASGGGSPTPRPPAATRKGATGGPVKPPATHPVAATGRTTPGALVGAVRWVLLAVLIAGLAGSLAGPLLMRAGRGRGREKQ